METQEIKEAEAITEIVLVKEEGQDLLALVKENDKPVFKAMANLNSLDWKNLQPNQMAFLLTQKPYPVSGGGTIYLTFRQALLHALRCYELNLSPLSSEVWYDPARGTTNVTLEGRKAIARNKGIELGPPQFEDLSRPWSGVPKVTPLVEELKKQGFNQDIGVKCRIRVGPKEYNEYSEYTCWLSEWGVPKSPVWQQKPQHMLQIRGHDKCISMSLGTGISDSVD